MLSWLRGRLAGWGHGRLRVVFGWGRRTRRVVRPRRSRCTACRVTHMLLPAAMLARRADEARVIGAAVTAAARGRGRRRIAAELGVPEETVRRWLRRFAARAERVREIFTGVAAAAAAIAARWPQLLAVSPWEIASAVTSATLLAPVITARAGNTNWALVT